MTLAELKASAATCNSQFESTWHSALTYAKSAKNLPNLQLAMDVPFLNVPMRSIPAVGKTFKETSPPILFGSSN